MHVRKCTFHSWYRLFKEKWWREHEICRPECYIDVRTSPIHETEQHESSTRPDVNTPEEEIHKHTRRRYTSRGSYIKSITVLSSATTCLFEPTVSMIPRFSTSPSFERADTRNAVKTDNRVKSLKQLLYREIEKNVDTYVHVDCWVCLCASENAV